MFIDRVLDNWSKVSIAPIFDPLHLDGQNLNINQLKYMIENSQAIECNNIQEFLFSKGEVAPLKDFPNIRPPFKYIWFEWDEGFNDTKEWIRKKGCLLREYGTADNNIILHLFNFGEGLTRKIAYLGCVGAVCDLEGKILGYGSVSQYFRDFLKDAGDEEKATFLARFLPIPLMTISFLHCKNVVIHSEDLPAKLQKARERRGKLPLFTFKTLEIKPMVKILKDQGESETKGLKHALHICRGHFKDFSKGPGLGRGHANGIYWWNSQVRGSKEVGAVIKDYKVSPELEVATRCQ